MSNTSIASPAWPRPHRAARSRWAAVAVAVLLAHGLLLVLLQHALDLRPERLPGAAPQPLVIVRLPPPVAAPAAPPAEPARTAPRPPRSAAPPRADAPVPETQSITPPALPSAAAPPVAATEAASAPAGSLLDTPATRRAIREAARAPSVAEQAALASGEPAPLSAQERFGQEVARGARGDCLKGEYPGAGMGLLSLPFWLVAELREQCRR